MSIVRDQMSTEVVARRQKFVDGNLWTVEGSEGGLTTPPHFILKYATTRNQRGSHIGENPICFRNGK